MLLNPRAFARLKSVTRITSWPSTTHAQRNEAARLFLDEVGRLLDQKAESIVKYAVERYSKEEISHEQYLELVDQVSKEEEARGATYGAEYARNRVFDFAQKALEKEQERAYMLALVEAKKQHELARQNAEQSIKDAVQQSFIDLKAIVEQYEEQSQNNAQVAQEKAEHTLDDLKEQTRTNIDQIVSSYLQIEADKREKERHDQEVLLPAREEADKAIANIADLEKRAQTHKYIKNGLLAVGGLILLALFVHIFIPFPQWVIGVLLAALVPIVIILPFWNSPLSKERSEYCKREIRLFRTKSNEYGPLSEEGRCALLIQRIS